MTAPAKQLHLSAFLAPYGHHVAAWRHPRTDLQATLFDLYRHQARVAEDACLDAIFFADNVALTGVPTLEPLTLLAALAATTTHLGLVGTATTTYNEPYHVARKFASLDSISNGRAGWNLVTSDNAAEAGNFGRAEHVAHAERYARAREFYDVVDGLWHTWERDAFVDDKDSAVLFDRARVHPLGHRGAHFSVAGALNVRPSPQGRPVVV